MPPSRFPSVSDRRVVVLLNRTARGVSARVRDQIRAVRIVDVYETEHLHEARVAMKALLSRRCDTLVLAGGDGTFVMGMSLLAEVCRGMGLVEPAIAMLPLGLANGMATALGQAAEDTTAKLRRLALGPTRVKPLPLLSVMGMRTPYCGVGIDAALLADRRAVSEAIDRVPVARSLAGQRMRSAAAAVRFVQRAFQRRPQVQLRNLGSMAQRDPGPVPGVAQLVATGDLLWQGTCTLAAAATVPYAPLGIPLFRDAGATPGRFLVRVSDANVVETMVLGERRRVIPGYFVDRVAVELDREVKLEVGGDVIGEHRRIEIALGGTIRIVD